MLSSKYWITNCILLTILAFGTFAPTLAFAAPLANNDKDWQYNNGNSWAWNYSPQNQINKDNVQNLEVKWIFPLGSKALAPAGIQALNPAEGTTTPPIVRNGIVYVTSNAMVTYAIDAKTGKQIWANSYTINITELQKRLPLNIRAPHFHGIRYWEGGDSILFGGLACHIYAIDVKTGKGRFIAEDYCKEIPGSIYNYSPTVSDTNNIATYDKGKQFVVNIGSRDVFVGVGRAVTMGVDMSTGKILWRVFNQPPQGEATKDWALQECDLGYFRNIPCKDVASKSRENLEWDFSPAPGQPQSPAAGSTSSWGQPVVDEDTGILYINTGNQNPWHNISQTRGPRLFGSTIMAIDMNAGKRIWWQQPMPRDPYDYDCNWSGMLMETKNIGKVYVKGCKEGFWIVSDAATGKPVRIIDVFEEQYPKTRTVHITDPFDRYDMVEWKWPENSKYHGPAPVLVYPSWMHGTFATDESYDPETGTVYHYTSLMAAYLASGPVDIVGRSGGRGSAPAVTAAGNVTIVARDLETGKAKWTWFYPTSNQRAHMVVSGGLLFSGFTDGLLRFLDKDTGKPLSTVNIGAPVLVGPTIGKDSDGNSKIFVLGGSMSLAANNYGYATRGLAAVPGTLVAVGLSDKAASTGSTSTVTTTSVASSTTTVTTATTVTETTGLPSEVTYAAVAIAVIAIIAAAVLVMRKK
ncbi:MAG: PQQ-binding-like beta-propeller repeat protein [Thaumarchaeota archaeon]|nr:PQQ-binding-like beta-propeller repeat protein [Nitrososphaerota archaeon]